MKVEKIDKKYKYFVSYNFMFVDQSGYGNCYCTLRDKISEQDIRDIQESLDKRIKDKYGNKCKCVVMNFKEIIHF